jgi:hypothetical protein
MTTKQPGVCEWFSLGEYERVEQVIDDLKRLGVRHLRTNVSWADWQRPGGEEWYRWLLPRLTRDLEVLPYLIPAAPLPGQAPGTDAPALEPGWVVELLDSAVTRFDERFEYVELWSDPDAFRSGKRSEETLAVAIRRAREHGKKVVLSDLPLRKPMASRVFSASRAALIPGRAAGMRALRPSGRRWRRRARARRSSGSRRPATPPGVTMRSGSSGHSSKHSTRRSSVSTGTACGTRSLLRPLTGPFRKTPAGATSGCAMPTAGRSC